MLGDRRYCLSAHRHRSCFALFAAVRGARNPTPKEPTFTAFERLFKERGLPQAIRSDNGVPFASPNGLFNLHPDFPFGGCGSASA